MKRVILIAIALAAIFATPAEASTGQFTRATVFQGEDTTSWGSVAGSVTWDSCNANCNEWSAVIMVEPTDTPCAASDWRNVGIFTEQFWVSDPQGLNGTVSFDQTEVGINLTGIPGVYVSALQLCLIGTQSMTLPEVGNFGEEQLLAETKMQVETPPVPPAPPNTILGSHPPAKLATKSAKVKVKFKFSSSTPGATFKCKLDKASFKPCTSPKTYKVKPGKHLFEVEAVNTSGADPTPASFRFKVSKGHK
jgi:hypothetical protein